MIRAFHRSLSYGLFMAGMVLGWWGLLGVSLELLATGCALLLGWAVHELLHPVTARRTSTARFVIWTQSAALLAVGVALVAWR